MGSELANKQDRTFGNVTVDPLSFGTPVDDPKIEEIIDFEKGIHIRVKEFISEKRYQELIPFRTKIKDTIDKRPLFGCAICSKSVYLIANKYKHFFFKHRSEDGSCPAETRGELSQDEIRARKYHGLRESEPHKRVKSFICDSLEADQSFKEIFVEKQWHSSNNPAHRRQPDVQAKKGFTRYAFEVQLSTTFLDVVVGRKNFYKEEGAFLIWIMANFDPDYRRMTTDDLLFNNNSNIFVVDSKTVEQSKLTKKFHLKCYFRVPYKAEGELADSWQSKFVTFDDLVFDQKNQCIWYFDYASAADLIVKEIRNDLQEKLDRELRQKFISFWIKLHSSEKYDIGEEYENEWLQLRDALLARKITIPVNPHDDSNFYAFLHGVLSAELGEPVGWKYKKLIEVGHKIAEDYPQHILSFSLAIKKNERVELLQQQDSSGKWKVRARKINGSIKSGGTKYHPDLATLPLCQFVFPEIAIVFLQKIQTSNPTIK